MFSPMRLAVSLEWLASVDCGSFQNCLSATVGAKEMNQPALGSWLLDCKGREMLASVFLPSPFIFATDLVAMDRGLGWRQQLSFIPTLSRV